MAMWLRIGGVLLVTMAVVACLEYFGVSSLLGGRSAEQVQSGAQGRTRELFWFMIFAVVMATSVLAAGRRWAGHLRRALAPAPSLKRRNVG